MHVLKTLTFPAALVAMSGLGVPAVALPASGPLAALRLTAAESNGVDQVRHRCYWHRGHLHCRRHDNRDYHPFYSYGYAPGFSLYLGGGGGRYWGGRSIRHGRHSELRNDRGR